MSGLSQGLVEAIALARVVADDCATDAAELEGKPFTGKVVAETFGIMLAEISALAKAVEIIAAAILTIDARDDEVTG